jgi:Tol biopolymer transport system component
MMRYKLAILLGCTLLVSCTISTQRQQTDLSNKKWDISISVDRDPGERYPIRLITSDGASETIVYEARNARRGEAASWSSDGKCIAFIRALRGDEITSFGNGQAAEIRCPEQPTRIIAHALNVAWSPDQQWLAIYRYSVENSKLGGAIWLMNLGNGQLHQLIGGLTDRLRYDGGLRMSWSADSRELAYENEVAGVWNIFVINITTRRQKHITQGRRPSWAPIRAEIAFDKDGAIWLIDSTGRNAHVLTGQPKGPNQWPSWSPSGDQIVFEARSATQPGIYRINRDGSDLKRLTHHASDGKPEWRPSFTSNNE